MLIQSKRIYVHVAHNLGQTKILPSCQLSIYLLHSYVLKLNGTALIFKQAFKKELKKKKIIQL